MRDWRCSRFALAALLCLTSAVACTCQQRGFQSDQTSISPMNRDGDNSDEAPSPTVGDNPAPRGEETSPAARLMPTHLGYVGAFRLPDEFNWGARGLSYHYRGDNGAGSLFVTGFSLSRTPNGEECREGEPCVALFSEVRIPTPQRAQQWEQLPMAELIRPLSGFDGGRVRGLDEFTWVSDIEFVPRQGTQQADRIYGALNLWYAEGAMGERTFPTIWLANLDGSSPQGLFHVGPERDPYHGRKMGDYLFSVPQWYAHRFLGGRILVTGRARGTPVDGRQRQTTWGGSQGPTLFAFHPFQNDTPSGNLDALPLLYYRTRFPSCSGPNVGDPSTCDFPGYTMCDLWTGASFVEGTSGRAIMLAGFKGLGSNCYDEPPVECNDSCSDDHGYHCHPYERQVIFYDVDELGRVAQREADPWSVLPYETWHPTEFFLQGQTCGTLGGMTFDIGSRRLFIVERGLGGRHTNSTVVHVWTAG